MYVDSKKSGKKCSKCFITQKLLEDGQEERSAEWLINSIIQERTNSN